MYSEELEMLIEAALEDGELTEKEKQILCKRAQAEGVDLDEFEMILDARLLKIKKANQAKAETPAPQSDKYGEMKKCPACGAIHVAGTAVCPDCGYAFSGIAATRSSQLLYEKLLNVPSIVKEEKKSMRMTKNPSAKRGLFELISSSHGESAELLESGEIKSEIISRKMTIIKDFPVPYGREDLIDFLTSLQPKADPKGPKSGSTFGGNENLSLAYWYLFGNCVNKARVAFANDPAFAPFIEYYDSKLNSQEGEKKRGLFRR